MAKTFHLTIAGVAESLFSGEALSVTLPGAEGTFTVLATHEPFVTPLIAGEAVVRHEGGEETFSIPEGALCEVSGGQATVLL